MSETLELWDSVAAASRHLRIALVPFVADKYYSFFELFRKTPPADLQPPDTSQQQWVLLVGDANGEYYYGPAPFNRLLSSFLTDAQEYVPLPTRTTRQKTVQTVNPLPTTTKRTWSLF